MTAKSTSCLDHFSSKGAEWSDLYKRATFKDRLNLFTRYPGEKLSSSAHILDFGCGSGVISLALASQGFQVTGVDGAPGMISAATEHKTKLELSNVQFYTIDPNSPSLKSESYDAIVCSSVLEYLPDDKNALQLFANTLKPGGWLFISVPNQKSLVGKLEDSIRKRRAKTGSADVLFCQRRYDELTFTQHLGELGFTNFSHTYFELPKCGKAGVPFSRLSILGVMMIVAAQKS